MSKPTTFKPLSQSEQTLLEELLTRSRAAAAEAEASSPGEPEDDWSIASMTDACKRRLSSPPRYAPAATAAPLASTAGVPLMNQMPTPGKVGITRKGTEIFLPPGVHSMQEWGATLIEFGKHATKRLTYAEMCNSKEKELITYVKWCRAQVDNMDGLTRDFALYACAINQEDEQGPLIPGTQHTRHFRQ